MFKKIFITLLFAGALFGNLNFCLAETTVDEMQQQLDAASGQAGYGKAVDPRETLFLIIRYALGMLGFVFVLLTIYAGGLWMTAGGAEDNIEKAKKILTAAVIGLIIILLSYAFTIFIFKLVLLEGAPFRKWN